MIIWKLVLLTSFAAYLLSLIQGWLLASNKAAKKSFAASVIVAIVSLLICVASAIALIVDDSSIRV